MLDACLESTRGNTKLIKKYDSRGIYGKDSSIAKNRGGINLCKLYMKQFPRSTDSNFTRRLMDLNLAS